LITVPTHKLSLSIKNTAFSLICSILIVVPFTRANAQQLPENQLISYLESLAKSDGGYGWEDQPDSHLTPAFAVVGTLYNLGRLPGNKEGLIEFIRTHHPQKGPNKEAGPSGTELRNLVYQQIQGILWLGGDPSSFGTEVLAWKSQAGKLANYEKKGYPVLMQELMTPICRGLLNLPSSDVKLEFESLLNSRKRENGSYNNAPSAEGGDGNILNTWWSLYALHQSGSFNQASPAVVAWINKCQLGNGGFTHQPEPEIGRNDEVAYTWAAVKSLDLFSAKPQDSMACIQYLLSLRNSDGGFGNRPGFPSTPMATFYAVDALKTLNALTALQEAQIVTHPPKKETDFSGYNIYTVQFQAGGSGSPQEAVMLADSLGIHLWGAKNAGAGWIETAQKIADGKGVNVTFFQSDESHERNAYVPGMGTFGHILDYIAPAGDGMVPFKKTTSQNDFRKSAIGLKESSTWAELRETAILPLAKNHGGFVLQVSNNEPLSRILLDESVNNGGYLAISTVHFGQNFLFWLPHLNQYRYQLPFIAMQDFHGIESWWWGNDLVSYRTLFLAKKTDVSELYTALRNNWVVALRHDSNSGYKTRMLGGTADARAFIQSRQKEWQWWNDKTQEMNHPWAAITVVTPTDTLEAGRPDQGINIRIRCWWKGVRQTIKEPLVTLEQLTINNIPVPRDSVKLVERKNVDSYYLYSLPNQGKGEHHIKVTLRHLKTNEVRVMEKLAVDIPDKNNKSTNKDGIPKLWGTNAYELTPEEWQASWIWRKGETGGTNLLLLARKKFSIQTVPNRATLYITADNNYELFLNGKFVNRGPARCQPHHQSYDIIEIAGLLTKGENVLAIRALHQGKFGSYNTPPRPGLLVQLDMQTNGQTEIIKSDASWKVTKPESTSLISPIYGESVDLRKEEVGWKESGFDDKDWSDADVLKSDRYWPWPEPSPKAKSTPFTFPWESLVPRDLPYLSESLVKGVNLVETGEILELGFNNAVAEGSYGLLFPTEKTKVTRGEGYKNGSDLLIIQNYYPKEVFKNDPIYSTYLIFDLGELMHGYPSMEIEGKAGTIIEFLYAPNLLRGKFPLRTDISGRPLTDRIVLSEGKSTWEALEMKYARYLFIAVRNTDQPVKLHFTGMKRADYPFEPKGMLTVSTDKEVEWLWKAATNTLRAITTDAFTDNYRERLQYAQTSYYAARSSYAAFGDRFLQKRYLQQISQEQQGDGVLPAAVPVTGYRGGRFLDASLFWVLGLHDYFLHSGDTQTVKDLLPVAKKVIDRFQLWENKEGIIDTPPYPYWIDHAAIDRYGANFSFNALYILTLQDMKSISEWLGNHDDAKEYERRAEKLRVFMREKFWDPQQLLFSDTWSEGKRSLTFTEQSNSLAIVAGIATKDQQSAIVKEFIDNKSSRLVPAVLFMHYLAESLFMSGYEKQALTLLKERYRHMNTDGDSSTLWEEWALTVSRRSGHLRPESNRTVSQAEQTFLTYTLSRWLLGIQPTKPGMKEIVISCHVGGLPEVKGDMPTPLGNVSVNWTDRGKGKHLEVIIPKGIRAFVDPSGKDLISKKVTIDGKAVNNKGRKIQIPEGKHLLIFN